MNLLSKIVGIFIFCAFCLTGLQAQNEEKESKVTIKTKKGEQTPEEWGEDLGKMITNALENSLEISEDNIENTIQNMLSGMEINLKDIKPSELDDEDNFNINDHNLKSIIQEIEKTENSKIKNIKELNLKFLGEDKVQMRMNAELENGKITQRTEILED